MDEIDDWDEALGDLGRGLGDAASVTAAFSSALRELRGGIDVADEGLRGLQRGFSGGLRRAFDGAVFDGQSLSAALRGLGRSMADTVYSAAMRPVTSHVGGLLADGVNALMTGVVPNANGAGFAQGRVMPFASGGVVSGPTLFPMRGGRTGLMGEAGPEAILPLARGADGRLGVESRGGGGVRVTVNVSTPDVEGFRRSRGQIAAELGRAMARGQRNR